MPDDYLLRTVVGEGGIERIDRLVDLPDKEPGRHRWIAACAYTLTPTQAAAADAGARVTLDLDMLFTMTVGCLDCEEPYAKVRTERCPAGDEWEK